jgi:serine/threonine protein kinase
VSSSLQEQLQRALGEAYLLERELGGGGMSRVFLALERALGRKVVVKVLLPELAAGVNVERFRREIQLAAQLQHPHIVPLLSAGEADGLPYFIMPFVTGESLRTRVAREGEFPIAETVRILRDVVSALAYAHAYGVIHRDVKPDNVLLSGGVAVVTDFGVAKAVTASSDSPGHTGLTSLGVALGTPAYMAPEQATASPNTDHRADIYALGIVAYEMLTGSPPFMGRSAQQVLAAQVVEEPDPVERRRPAVPPMLANLVNDCLSKRPADRPQTAAAVMHALDAIATPSGGTAATTAVRLPAATQATRLGRKWPLLPSAVALVLLLWGGVLWVGRTKPATAPSPSASSPEKAGTTVPPVDSLSRIHPGLQVPPTPVEPPAARPSAVTRGAPSAKKARRDPVRSQTPRPPAPVAQESLTAKPAAEPPAAIESVPSPAAAAPPAVPPPVAVADSTPPQPSALTVTVPTPAPRSADPAPEIRGVIAEYAGAVESESLDRLRRVYPGMTGLQQTGWEQFFQLVRDVKALLSVARLDAAGSTADAQITGTYTYLNTSSGRTESQPVSFHATFRNEGGRWRISQVR